MIRDFEIPTNGPSIQEQRAAALVAYWGLEDQGLSREETRAARDRISELGGADPESSRLALEMIAEQRSGTAEVLGEETV